MRIHFSMITNSLRVCAGCVRACLGEAYTTDKFEAFHFESNKNFQDLFRWCADTAQRLLEK